MRNDLSGQIIEDYRIIHSIGRGNFGEVYLAEHIQDRTPVAIKILFMEMSAGGVATSVPEDDSLLAINTKNLFDFLNEARAIRLEHPHILRIRDFGIAQQGPFLVMDYMPNGNLRQRHPRGAQLSWETVVSYAKQVAAALQHIHDHHIVHRDVKPENMLIGQQGEILLSDFGIATTSYTWDAQRLQESVGTASYIAPEQINSQAVRASDQYSLGVIMYEWLLGTPPFEGTSEQVVMKHLMVPPPPLRARVPALHPQAEAIVMRMLAKDPKERFTDMLAFVAALDMMQTVVLHPMVFSGHHAGIRTLAWSPDGQSIVSAGRDKAILVWEATTGNIRLSYHNHDGEIWSVAWSSDNRSIVSASDDLTVQVWDASTGQLHMVYDKHARAVLACAFSPDGRLVASAGEDNAVHVWEVATGNTLSTYRRHGKFVRALAWSPGGESIASGGDDNGVHIWEVQTGMRLHLYKGHSERVTALTWSPDGEYLATASDDQSVQVWEIRAGERLHIYKGHNDVVAAVAWSPDGKYLASGSWDKTVQVWQVGQQAAQSIYRAHTNWVNALAWSPDSSFLAAGSWDKTVQLFPAH